MELKEWLISKKLTPIGFSRKLKVNPQTIYNAINGKEMSFKIVCVIVAATKGRVQYIDMLPAEMPKTLKKRLRVIDEARCNTPTDKTKKEDEK